MGALEESLGMPRSACPTCRGTGPDVFDWDWEAQMYEARCGDEWHDAQGAPLASDEEEQCPKS
jgi:hypothetical protein